MSQGVKPRYRRFVMAQVKKLFCEDRPLMLVYLKGFPGTPVCCLFSLVISRKAF